MDHSGFTDMYAGQWMASDHAHAKPPHMSPEDIILHAAASHMQSANPDFAMDGSMAAASMAHAQMLDRDDNEDGDSMVGHLGAPRPVASRSSANNELEMRQLFGANRHRNLQDVAGELHGNERGPNSERTRQVFAMLWYASACHRGPVHADPASSRINSVCSKGKGSVPRGRVYANYASRCATERITVLNPASFGKLVRVLFPGLKTRRLGVRGESKYHYVNFALAEDMPDLREAQPPQIPRPLPEAKEPSRSFRCVQWPAWQPSRASLLTALQQQRTFAAQRSRKSCSAALPSRREPGPGEERRGAQDDWPVLQRVQSS